MCITPAANTGNFHGLTYLEKCIAVNGVPGRGSEVFSNGSPGHDDTYVNFFYQQAMRWAQTDAPARLTCDSFCKRCDKPLGHCPDTATSPIAELRSLGLVQSRSQLSGRRLP